MYITGMLFTVTPNLNSTWHFTTIDKSAQAGIDFSFIFYFKKCLFLYKIRRLILCLRLATLALASAGGLLDLLLVLRGLVGLGRSSVDRLSVVLLNQSDQALGVQLIEGLLRERGADLHALRNKRGGDQFVGGHLLDELVVCCLVEEDQVVQLVADLSL